MKEKKYVSPVIEKVVVDPKKMTVSGCGTPGEMATSPWHPCKSSKE